MSPWERKQLIRFPPPTLFKAFLSLRLDANTVPAILVPEPRSHQCTYFHSILLGTVVLLPPLPWQETEAQRRDLRGLRQIRREIWESSPKQGAVHCTDRCTLHRTGCCRTLAWCPLSGQMSGCVKCIPPGHWLQPLHFPATALGAELVSEPLLGQQKPSSPALAYLGCVVWYTYPNTAFCHFPHAGAEVLGTTVHKNPLSQVSSWDTNILSTGLCTRGHVSTV